MANVSLAQSRQQQKVDSVFEQVKKYFNQKNADAIYNMAGRAFQNELNIDAFSDVANKQLFPLGQIKESSLISFVNNSVATYKLKFESITLQLLMSLDKQNRLELFLFQSYVDPPSNKTALVASSNPMLSEMDKKLDTIARSYIQKASTAGLCIGIISNGKTSVYRYGEMIKGKGKLPNADSFFELGSITKTFTAILLAKYVNDGIVKLNDPIIKYLPDSVAANINLKPVTLLQLINHTSGLPRLPDNLIPYVTDAQNPYKDYTKPLLYAYLKSCKLNSIPGQQYAYSNLGVGLLGCILENISGKTFEQQAKDIICKPLNMQSTSQFLNPLLLPRFVEVYNQNGEPTVAWDFDALAACGALRSTMNDMLKFASANLHPGADELSKAITLTHHVTYSKDVKIGMAWHVITVNGIDYTFHNGGTNGSSSFLAFNSDKNIAVIILSNANESTDAIGTKLLSMMQ